MDPIREAFAKAKQDILELQSQIFSLSQNIREIKRTLDTILSPRQTDRQINQTNQQINPTDFQTPTDNLPYNSLKGSNLDISTGNGGVPTDRQTNQQTDQHMTKTNLHPINDTNNQSLTNVAEVVNSLDNMKQDLKSKFKKLTSQEMLVFSTVYQLEEQGFIVDYPLLASKLSLSESSIRDYTQKIIKKGVPLVKTKENNKKITLSILPDLKKIASINTILALREI